MPGHGVGEECPGQSGQLSAGRGSANFLTAVLTLTKTTKPAELYSSAGLSVQSDTIYTYFNSVALCKYSMCF